MSFRERFWLVTIGLLALLIVAVVWSLSVGEVHLRWLAALQDRSSTDALILWQTRLPRVLFAVVVGAALGLAGATVQGLFRNPLATPYTLGVSGGASLGAVLAIQYIPAATTWGFPLVFVCAFALALATIYGVYRLAWSSAGLRLMTLLLAGIIVNVIASSAIMLFQYFSGFTATLKVLHWLMGDLGIVGYDVLWKTAVFVGVGCFVLLGTAKPLNAVSLGEETAISMGVDARGLERRIYFAASLVVAAVVSSAGPIGFIGLVAPHVLRLLFGPDARLILPGSMLFGALLLLVADTTARTLLAPTEIPVGVFTAAFGGTFFLYLLWKSRRDLWA